MKTIKFIDLFAGMGGMRLGFEQACSEMRLNAECVFTSEIKKSAIQAYQRNMKDVVSIAGDITQVDTNTIPNFDVLLAGFPCQPFSTAGKQLGFEDTRGTLFFEIERILKDKKPTSFILENVQGLVIHDRGNTFKVIQNKLINLGYHIEYKVLDSKYHGVAQSRKRIYILGVKNESYNKKINLENFNIKEVKLKDILEKGIPVMKNDFTEKLLKSFSIQDLEGKAIKDKRGGENNIHSWEFDYRGEITNNQKELMNKLLKERRQRKYAKEYGIAWQDGMPLTLKMIQNFYQSEDLKEMLDDLIDKRYLKLKHPKNLSNGKRFIDTTKEMGYDIAIDRLTLPLSRILDSNDVSLTLVATDDTYGVTDIGGIRNLTIREELRLQGYPDWYDLSFLPRKKAHDLIGNTVVVPVVKDVSIKLLNSVFL